MNRPLVIALVVAVAAVLIVASMAVFTVHQTEQVLVLQFGNPKRVYQEPGLKFKIPFIQAVTYYDRRLLPFDAPVEEVINSDQKRLVVDAFARYRIDDPLLFYQAVQTVEVVRARLGVAISASLRQVLGEETLLTVLSGERTLVMNRIRDLVNEKAKDWGVNVVDVRIKRADLPDENSQAIFRRMQAEREREAREFRAQGAEIGQRIRSRAERERTVLVAEANKESEITRGEGDAESVRIFAEAFGRDIEFYSFYRSMNAYRKALGSEETTMVLSPDSEFFRFFGTFSGDREE